MAPESEKEDTLNITEPSFGHRVEADIENHIVLAKKFLNSIVKNDEYVRRHPIIWVRKKLFDVRHPRQFGTKVMEQRLQQRGVALLNEVDDGLCVDTAVVSIHLQTARIK